MPSTPWKNTVGFAEGYRCYKTKQPCTLSDPTERADWPLGFNFAREEDAASKAWWRSNTIRIAIVCGTASLIVLAIGYFMPSQMGNVVMGAGGGMSVSSILAIGIRQAISSITWNNSGGSSWSNYGQ